MLRLSNLDTKTNFSDLFSIAIATLVAVTGFALGSPSEVKAQRWSTPVYGGGTVVSKPAWANNMFAKTKHDFETVARASKQVHDFEFTNTSGSDMHISGVRVSCQCAEPKILNKVVKPNEKGVIRVGLNTLRFVGDRKATITVSISSPQWTEVQLEIVGTVRQDIVVNPGSVDFQTVSSGSDAQRTVDINYAGSDIWKIKEVRSSNPAIKCELKETKRGQGLVSYKATVSLGDSAAAGYLADRLTFVTNDNRLQEFPVNVTGYVKPSVEGPSMLNLGRMEKGQTLKKKIVIRSVSEFKILAVSCADKRIKVEHKVDEKKKLHFLDVTVTGSAGGKITEPILVKTDLASTKIKLAGDVRSTPDGNKIVDDKEE